MSKVSPSGPKLRKRAIGAAKAAPKSSLWPPNRLANGGGEEVDHLSVQPSQASPDVSRSWCAPEEADDELDDEGSDAERDQEDAAGGDDEPYLQGRVLELANAAGDTHQAEHVIFELRSFDLCR